MKTAVPGTRWMRCVPQSPMKSSSVTAYPNGHGLREREKGVIKTRTLSDRDLHVFGGRRRLRNRDSFFAHPINVKLDGLPD